MTINDASQKKEEIVQEIVRTRFTWLPRATLALSILLTVLVGTVVLRLVNPFSEDFIVNTMTTVLPSFFTFVIFSVIYKWKDMAENKLYASWIGEWSKKSNEVRDKKKEGAFVEYCKRKVEEEKEEIFHARLETALISPEDYRAKYAMMTRRQLKKEMKAGRLEKKQYKILASLTKPIKVKPVQSSLILRGVERGNVNDAGRATGGAMRYKYLSKIAWSIASVIVVSSLIPTISEDFAFLPFIFSAVIRVFSVTMSAFTGAFNGIDAVTDMTNKIKLRTMYIEVFLEECE